MCKTACFRCNSLINYEQHSGVIYLTVCIKTETYCTILKVAATIIIDLN